MAKVLFKLGRWCFNKKWTVIITWLLLLLAVGGSAFSLMKPFTSEFSIDGTPSIDATRRVVELFPGEGNPANAPGVNLAFKAPEGEKLSDPDNEKAVEAVIQHLEDNLVISEDELRFGNPLEVSPQLQRDVEKQMTDMGLPEAQAKEDAANLGMVNEDETIAYTTFNFDAESPYSVTEEQFQTVADAMDIGREMGIQVEAGGAGYGGPITINSTSEVIGLGVAFIVLVVTFGSLVSSILPLITAVVGVGTGVLGLFISTHWLTMNDITPVLAVMIGLAVGIDYALFIMSRYRSERAHMKPDEAAGMAVGTAGSSVVFAGATVFIALFALVIAKIEFLTVMGIAAAATVAISVLVALTLIPALLGVFGDKVFAGRIPGIAGNPNRRGKKRRGKTMGHRWATLVQRGPGVAMAFVVLTLGLLTAPAMNMQLALPSDVTSNPDTTQRKAADLLTEGFGAGVNGPFLVLVDATDINPDAPALQPLVDAQASAAEQDTDQAKPQSKEDMARLSSFLYATNQLKSIQGIKHAQLVGANQEGTAAQIMVTPETGPADERTVQVAHALRSFADEIEDATGTTVGTTGLTAVQVDITERLESAMGPYLAVVVGLAIFLLLLVFRSILVPLVAGIGFLLSVGAAFGVTVLFWQEGLWGLVPSPAPLISFLPIFLIGVTFGLAMDYQVFLVTRMREHYIQSGQKVTLTSKYNAVEESTIIGFGQGARVVTAAAIIMISVFVAFINQPIPFIQIFGFALAAGVLFDAFFVRMTLVPATMFLMGHATWWMPKWLDKILPNIDIEGTALEEEWARHNDIPEAASAEPHTATAVLPTADADHSVPTTFSAPAVFTSRLPRD
ncbi:MMPL family transporter [Corynebacterium incognita]|uniref:MMPL family transporter n=1 Tax=Corynebacterium incognita TaxID=2754725 RepID=A0A7G7CMB7_9CORY|nr:MMPL family transporter [Corynebacterium incognita]QNE88733.1 MMPL family transporter [Corynebacterium incognita]